MITIMQNEIVQSLLPLIIINAITLLSCIIFIFIYPSRKKDPEIVNRMHETFLGLFFREYWYWLNKPFINFFIFFKIKPNVITALSLISAFVSAYYFYIGNFGLAGWILIISATLDIIDGRVARSTNTVTKSGAYWDSCADRYSEGVVLLGIALYYQNNFIACLATIATLIGSELVSYTKARGEAIGVTTTRGVMQRAERLFTLCIVSVLHPFFQVLFKNTNVNPEIVMISAMILMAVATNLTAITRLRTIFMEIKRQENNA
ncbi:MAG: CDP-alcohol phosphatidyltransferase family protein [Spirochaetes bacterium]|nr:CDP-alcohol phosphatidyltransferase family protein [Spirochaetota bacterium]MBP8987192.1 CDP-alcohol phosphatidyltransferase family protein [Spirochaetota bacterium]HQQ51062.1 CDP-alcohol phosphatidyltransferase family protein [Spirochaetota bacterium]